MGNFKMQGGAQRLGYDPGDTSGGFVPYVTQFGGSGGSSTNTGQVTCASAVAATQIVAANPSRIALHLSNLQNGKIWISNTSASTTASSTGYVLLANAAVDLHTQSAVYGLASSGTTADLSYLEEVQ